MFTLLMSCALSFTFSKADRFPVQKSLTPAPNAYTPNALPLTKGIKIGQEKRFKVVNSETPGPGAYTLPSTLSKKGTKFSYKGFPLCSIRAIPKDNISIWTKSSSILADEFIQRLELEALEEAEMNWLVEEVKKNAQNVLFHQIKIIKAFFDPNVPHTNLEEKIDGKFDEDAIIKLIKMTRNTLEKKRQEEFESCSVAESEKKEQSFSESSSEHNVSTYPQKVFMKKNTEMRVKIPRLDLNLLKTKTNEIYEMADLNIVSEDGTDRYNIGKYVEPVRSYPVNQYLD